MINYLNTNFFMKLRKPDCLGACSYFLGNNSLSHKYGSQVSGFLADKYFKIDNVLQNYTCLKNPFHLHFKNVDNFICTFIIILNFNIDRSR